MLEFAIIYSGVGTSPKIILYKQSSTKKPSALVIVNWFSHYIMDE